MQDLRSPTNPYQVNVPLDHGGGNPQSVDSLTRKLRLALQIFIGIAVLYAFQLALYALVIGRLEGGQNTLLDSRQAEAEFQDLISAVVAILYFLGFATCCIISIFWIIRAHNRVRQAVAEPLPIRPHWAVIWFVVPIFSLWKPFAAMKQLWQASENPKSWTSVQPPGILSLWWFLYIVSNVLGTITYRLGAKANTLEELYQLSIVELIFVPVDIILPIVYLKIVTRIADMQAKWDVLTDEAGHTNSAE